MWVSRKEWKELNNKVSDLTKKQREDDTVLHSVIDLRVNHLRSEILGEPEKQQFNGQFTGGLGMYGGLMQGIVPASITIPAVPGKLDELKRQIIELAKALNLEWKEESKNPAGYVLLSKIPNCKKEKK